MKFDFDKVVDRHGTKMPGNMISQKKEESDDMLPLWVADMDSRQHRESEKLKEVTQSHTICGSDEGKDDYFQAATGWYEKHFGWKVEKRMADQDTGRGIRTRWQ